MSYQNKSREELIEALRQLEKENRELQHAISKGADMQTITENGEMVRLSEECFREVLENSIDASYKRNLHTSMYDYLSPVFIQICGYTADEMNAMPLDMVLGLMHPDDVFKVNRVIAEALASTLSGAIYHTDYRFRHKRDGRYRWLHDKFTVMYDLQGKPSALIGSVSDITERKQAEEALRESDSLLRKAQQIAHLGSWSLDLISNTLEWSDEIYRIFGVQPQEFSATYEAFLDTIHPDDRYAVNAAYTTSLQEGKNSYEIEHRIIQKNTGEVRHVYEKCEHIKDASGNIISSVGMVHDITDRKAVERDLEQSKSELNAIYEFSHVMMCLVDSARQILFANPAFTSLTGIEEEFLKGGQACGVFGCINALENIRGCGFGTNCGNCNLRLAMEDTLLTGKGHINIEYHAILLQKGESREVYLLGSTALIESNNQRNLLLCLHDITERKKAEVALKESDIKLRKLNDTLEKQVEERTKKLETINRELTFHLKEIEQFLYISSHDLSEPLNTLTNFTQLLHDEYAGKLDKVGNTSIDFIFDSATRMKLLLKGLLDYSLLGKGSVKSSVDCNEVVAEVLSDLGDAIKTNDARIVVTDLPRLNAHETEIRLLFQHLINNAIKFRRKELRPEINISAGHHEQEWKFAIADNGIGIKEHDKEKIFIIFRRMVKRDEYEGTGIGLAHCKKIVELHGGRIWVEDNEAGGSTFCFTIPG